MKAAILYLLPFLIFFKPGYSQPPNRGARFDVVSVKRINQFDRTIPMGCNGGPGTSDPATWTCRQTNLSGMIARLYDLKVYQFAPPDWMVTSQFSVTAKVPPGTTKEAFIEMQRNLLYDRFSLRFHWDTREATVYELVVASSGTKLL